MKFQFLHLIPDDGYGGVENATRYFNFFENEKFLYRSIFITNNVKKNNKILLKENIKVFNDYLEKFLYLIRKKNTILIISLWKSCLLSLLVKIFNQKIKLILFLHSTRNKHFVDFLFTSLILLFVDEIWSDSSKTLEKRLSSLFFKKNNIQKKVISFRLSLIKPLSNSDIKPNFIYWGRLNKNKNIGSSIKLFKLVFEKYNNANFKIIGKDEGIKIKLERLVSQYGLENNIQFYDFMEMSDIISIARDCSFFIQLSLYEGMALSVVEAMQLGIVPIVTSVGEIENYCKHNFNSIIYEDQNNTIKDIERILKNKNLFLMLRKNVIETWEYQRIYSEDIIFNCESFSNRYKI